MSIYLGNTNIGSVKVGAKEQTKTVTPSTSAQVITPDAGYNTLSSVNVSAVTAAIDANITPSNIKKDVTILGVTGTMEPMPSLVEFIKQYAVVVPHKGYSNNWSAPGIANNVKRALMEELQIVGAIGQSTTLTISPKPGKAVNIGVYASGTSMTEFAWVTNAQSYSLTGVTSLRMMFRGEPDNQQMDSDDIDDYIEISAI